MGSMFEAPEIPGAADVLAWFGYWPTFHDAEVLSIALNRSGESCVAIQAWEITPEIDPSGSFVLAKHAVVTFRLTGFPQDEWGITRTEIASFNGQNVLSGAVVKKIQNGYELVLEGIHGVDGSIVCERMSVTLEPHVPLG
jgi:hypothetical protein